MKMKEKEVFNMGLNMVTMRNCGWFSHQNAWGHGDQAVIQWSEGPARD